MAALPDKPKTTGEFALRDVDLGPDADGDHPSSEALLAYTSAGMSAGQGLPHARPPGREPRSPGLGGARRPGAAPRVPRPLRRGHAGRARLARCASTSAARRWRTSCPSSARCTAARSPTRSSTSRRTSSASGCARRSSRARFWRSSTPEEQTRNLLIRLLRVEGLEHFLKRDVPRREAVLDRGPRRDDPDARRGGRDRRRGRHRGRDARHGAPRPAERARPRPATAVRAIMFAEFEGEHAADVETRAPDDGSGDVKYHYGASTAAHDAGRPARSARSALSLLPNPSHLEFVEPGRRWAAPARCRRATRRRPRSTRDPRRRLAVLIHGDAAFSGQGIVAESLNLQSLPRLQHRRRAAPDRQQPDRLHHRSARRPLDASLVRPGEGLQRPDHPRQRRRPRRLPRRGAAGDGVPRPLRPRRA